MAKLYPYRTCYLSDIAQRVGYGDVGTFLDCLTPADFQVMIDLGWRPVRTRLLPPPIVKYLMDKFCPDYIETTSQ